MFWTLGLGNIVLIPFGIEWLIPLATLGGVCLLSAATRRWFVGPLAWLVVVLGIAMSLETWRHSLGSSVPFALFPAMALYSGVDEQTGVLVDSARKKATVVGLIALAMSILLSVMTA